MSGVRRADQVYTGIVEYITARHLGVGERLPSEAQLAETFDVSRAVVREALVRLAADGITVSRRGAGSYVNNTPSDRLISYASPGTLSAILGTYEVRLVLETEVARLAAARRSVQDMLDIGKALRTLQTALSSGMPAHAEDMELHRRIVLATANPAFLAAFEALSIDVNRTMHAGVEISRSRPPEVIWAMMREHEAIVAAIRVQDSDGAALTMRWHLSEGRKRLMPGA